MRLFQIFYDDATKASLDPGFIPLDNTHSARPDWFEYWPIRQVFLNSTFDDEEYLGFFSPRFKEKTGLSGEQVIARVGAATHDVVNFSPFLDQSAAFPNSFHQANLAHPGCLRLSGDYLDAVGLGIDLNSLVQDQTRTIFSNYFVAKYRFWKKWTELSNQLFEVCEDSTHPLRQQLCIATRHRGTSGYEMKIFIMERMVSLVLELQQMDAELGIDYSVCSPYGTGPMFNNLLVLDALKGQYLKTGSENFLGIYMRMRKEVLNVMDQMSARQAAALAQLRGRAS